MAHVNFKDVSKKEVLRFLENDTNRQEVHDVTRLDYNAISASFTGTGSFTARQITNALKERGVIDNALVFVKIDAAHEHKPPHYTSKGIYTFYVKAFGSSAYGYKLDTWGVNGLRLEDKWRKSDYEDIRKEPEKEFLVVSAPSLKYYENIRDARKTYPIETGVRYVFTDKTHYFEAGMIHRKPQEYNYSWKRSSAENAKIDFDKSGYFVRKQREDIQNRASAMKAEKLKNAFLQTDFTAKIDEMKNRIDSIRSASASALLSANTYEEMEKIEDVFDSWGGIPSIMRSFERYQDSIKEKKYSSNEDAERSYNYMLEKCEKIENILSLSKS